MLTPTTIDDHAARVADLGYTVVEDAIAPELLDALAASLDHLERVLGTGPGTNSFEGHRTVRVYNLLAHDSVWQQVPVHEHVLPIVERVLDPGCLVSSLSSIRIGPGETAQMIHADDQLIPIPRPHPPVVCNSMWALTDFTAENGATRLVPGSHRADHAPDLATAYDSIPAEMPRGSVLIWDGALWHGGGANSTDADRIGIAMNYCAGYIRQQENQLLGIPRAVAATFPTRLRRLVGYSVYSGLIGHIDRRDPVELLDDPGPAGPSPMVWDAIG